MEINEIIQNNANDYISALKIVEKSKLSRKEKDLISQGIGLYFHILSWRNNDYKKLFPKVSLISFLEGLKLKSEDKSKEYRK